MKIQTTQILLFSLVLSGMGFAAVGLSLAADLTPGETQAKAPSQQGYGHAPHLPLGAQAKAPSQQGYGHAPHPPLGAQAKAPSQQGYGHAPHPPLGGTFTRYIPDITS